MALRRDIAAQRGQPVGVALRAGERDGLGEPRLVQVADHHPGALSKKRERGGATDAAAAPGDDRDLAVEPPAPPVPPASSRGFTQVSDHARVALLPCRSPRISAHTLPGATLPLISSWAERAGKNVLNTPIGRSLKPGGALSTKGSMQSYQDSVTRASAVMTVSVARRPGAAVPLEARATRREATCRRRRGRAGSRWTSAASAPPRCCRCRCGPGRR